MMHKKKELYHYGVKGMKWGVRRYQNYDGTRINTKKNGLHEDQVWKKGTTLRRVSNAKETTVRRGEYLTRNYNDFVRYIKWAYNCELNFKDYDDLYKITIVPKSDIRVKRGREVAENIIASNGDTDIKTAYGKLMADQVFYNDRYTPEQKSYWYQNYDPEGAKNIRKAAHFVNDFMEKHGDEYLEAYKNSKNNYDLIGDPVDTFSFVDTPMMVNNPSKFKIKKTEKLYSKSGR